MVGGTSLALGQPRPLLIGDEQLVAFTRAVPVPVTERAAYEVVLVRRARETAPTEVMVIDTRVDGSDATRLVADSAGQRVLIAWPAAFGGFRFVERR